MESVIRLALTVLLVSTVSLFSTSSAAPALNEQSQRSTYLISDDQVVRLKHLLARLRAENQQPTTEASVKKPSDQKSVKEGKQHDEEHQQSSTDSATHKPQSRALSSEDMHTRDMDIVEQLRHLDKADTAEILARALSKIDEEARDSAGEKTENREKEEGGSNSAGDDMGTSNNGDDAQGNPETEPVDSTQLIEALIKQGLAKLDGDNGNKPQSLFHPEPRPLPRNNKRPVKKPLYERYLDLKRADQKGEDNHESTEEEQMRQKDLEMIESRLMQDIQIANMLGVSVEDLIRDLEERAYIAAHAKRIGELLDVHEQGRDEE